MLFEFNIEYALYNKSMNQLMKLYKYLDLLFVDI